MKQEQTAILIDSSGMSEKELRAKFEAFVAKLNAENPNAEVWVSSTYKYDREWGGVVIYQP